MSNEEIFEDSDRVSHIISELIDTKIELVLLRDLGVPPCPVVIDAKEQNELIDKISKLENELSSWIRSCCSSHHFRNKE